ncbi:MAG TPA: 30S ribosomal protein S7 [Firmicutes bacterium]|nr:30S ribosomal protein S7 [Bacillota bacterium]
MPRKKRAEKREIAPDPRFNSVLVARLVNCIMFEGRKATAERIVYTAFEAIEKQGKDPLPAFKQAIENIKPMLELKSRRIGGANYQIPVEVNPDRRVSLALRWLVNSARARKEKTTVERLMQEIIAAEQSQGGAVKKKDDIHKMAEANKAFAHYRW